MDASSAYDLDFYAWASRQAGLLRGGRLAEADIERIAEEIESLGKSEKRELISRLGVLLLHLIKWRFQPERRTRSWRSTIAIQRRRLSEHLKDNPSLKAIVDEAMVQAWGDAVLAAMAETDLDESVFPCESPWTFEAAMEEAFWPD